MVSRCGWTRRAPQLSLCARVYTKNHPCADSGQPARHRSGPGSEAQGAACQGEPGRQSDTPPAQREVGWLFEQNTRVNLPDINSLYRKFRFEPKDIQCVTASLPCAGTPRPSQRSSRKRRQQTPKNSTAMPGHHACTVTPYLGDVRPLELRVFAPVT